MAFNIHTRDRIDTEVTKGLSGDKVRPTLFPMARPKPHGTAATSRSPTCVLISFLALSKNLQHKHGKKNM